MNKIKVTNIRHIFFFITLVLLYWCAHNGQLHAQSGNVQLQGRITISLDGTWQIEESVSDSVIPLVFSHTVPVPGLVNLARPAFKDAGKFISRELANHPLYKDPGLPSSAATAPVGISLQERNFFWYSRSFKAPEIKEVAILKIGKAQFGTAVWLNGIKIGNHEGCFTAGYFNLTEAMRWNENNILVIRIGAHPGVLPLTVPAGTDLEKSGWMPGIYDRVSVFFCDNPVIGAVQVAPRINNSEIVVQTVIRNYGLKDCSFKLTHRVRSWVEGKESGSRSSDDMILRQGEEKTVTEVVKMKEPILWSPENPFLYVVESGTGKDQLNTRFGMREFHFDRATGWAYLNGKPYFLRGANITLHRFFEDPDCGSLPWQEQWVRKLLVDIPKEMHWNSFRFCIGPVPDFWMDIADEAGLLIAHQYFIWVPGPKWGHFEWDLVPEFTEWMRDNWNHPSQVVWDACNETNYPALSEKVIPAVRHLDLSNRPWQLSNNPPDQPDDPVERHLYVLPGNDPVHTYFDWTCFEKPPRIRQRTQNRHPGIVNEYGEFWLNRDGTPTTLTDHRFRNFLAGPEASADDRFEAAAYYLAGETEYHRAYRQWAAVQHFTYLTSSTPGGYTADNFRDVKNLILDPFFKDYAGEAFKPLGVNLSFWQPSVRADSLMSFRIMMVNDYQKEVTGQLVLSLETSSGKTLTQADTIFAIPEAGKGTYDIKLKIPNASGKCLLRATAYPSESMNIPFPTVSRRKVCIIQSFESFEEYMFRHGINFN